MIYVYTHSSYHTLLVKTGYNKQDCVVTRLSALMFEKHRDIRITAGKITCRKVISWNVRVIVVLEEDGEIEIKRDVTQVHVIVLNHREQKGIAYVL